MRLLDILIESKSDESKIKTISAAASPLLSGRPSQNIKEFRARAGSDPKGLLDDLGVEPKDSDKAIDFLFDSFSQMINDATGNDKAKLLKDLFDKPEIVKSRTGKRKGILIKLSGEGLKLALDEPKKFLRTYAFWFSSVVEALEAEKGQLNLNLTTYAKFQYISSESAIIIFRSRNSWASL
jgi:hypothetical protein